MITSVPEQQAARPDKKDGVKDKTPVPVKSQGLPAKSASVKKAAKKKREEEVLDTLTHLRTVTKEISRAYIANVERDILEISHFIASTGKKKGGPKAIDKSTLDRMEEILHGLSLKPSKGRRSDLKKIDKAVGSIARLIS